MQLRLQLDGFEGPLELLLSLVEQRRLPITQVSLAQVADQYLSQVRNLPRLDADLLADFLAIGGKLLLLKSKALLLTEDHDPVVEETAADLEERLITYRVFRTAAQYLQELEQRDQRTYPSTREPQASTLPAPLAPIVPTALVEALRRLQRVQARPLAELPPQTRVSVDEQRAAILDGLRTRPRLSFRALAGYSADSVVATFLAVLELFRRGLIGLAQPTHFADLDITRA